jgi:exopolysaccharide production protein ExoQ
VSVLDRAVETHLARAASFVLGVILPLAMLPSTKSSPLMLCIAALLACAALISAGGVALFANTLLSAFRKPAGWTAFGLLAYAAVSISWAHNPTSSMRQFVEMFVAVASGTVLALLFPRMAPQGRAGLWVGAAVMGALVMVLDLETGLWLRDLTGGRATDYSYNRAAVTLVVLILPLAALAMAEGKRTLLVCLATVAVAGIASASGTAKLALTSMVLVFPVAYVVPRFAGWAGLGVTLLVLAGSLFSGSLGKLVFTQRFHETLKDAHSGDRVDIWLSFEAVARQTWLFGQGFGSSLNLQNASVAKVIVPERVLLLGASHPHNAFLQLWVELGLVGVALASTLVVLFFISVMQRAELWLRPYWITWFAVVAAVAAVSHGAWQPWWMAAIAASAVGLLSVKSPTSSA